MIQPAQAQPIGSVLRELALELDGLGAALCKDPALAQRFLQELQVLDRISQVQLALADVISADCWQCAASEVKLGSLRYRLEESSPAAISEHTVR